MGSTPAHPGAHLLLAFEGLELPPAVRTQVAAGIGSGMTVFAAANVATGMQLRALTDELRRAASRPLIVCADQEGGQFLALGEETTPFAGNLALGAAGDPELTERVGRAMGAEVRAMGVDLDYAPDCDLLIDLANPSVGIRSFGDDPAAVAAHAAAFVRGLRAAGAAACPKHFPGKGAAGIDSHHGLPVIDRDADRLRAADLAPFRAAMAAGADAVMSSHAAYPALTGRPDLPGTVSTALLTDLLRDELGFGGVAITDALDMGALAQGAGQVVEAVAALRAGADLLLATTEQDMAQRLAEGLAVAASRGLLDSTRLAASAERIHVLAARLHAAPRPDLDVVGCRAHRELAAELAALALTLVRDPGGLLPLRTGSAVLALMPRPFDRTPADTSSTVDPHLAPALRAAGLEVVEHVLPADPDAAEIAAVLPLAAGVDAAVVGTIDAFAHPGQVALVEALQSDGTRVVTASLRTPDAHALPGRTTHVCSYAVHRPSMDALARALVGDAAFPGRLPVTLPAQHGGGAP